MADVIEDGVGLDRFALRGQPSQGETSGTAKALVIGVLLVYSATECGDQIIQLFFAAHRQRLT